MTSTLRKPFFIAALVLIGLVVLLEIGAAVGLLGGEVGGSPGDLAEKAPPGLTTDERDQLLDRVPETPPGQAIPAMALVDGLLFFVVALMAVGLLVGERVQARIHGPALLIFSILLLLGAIVLILKAIALVVLMVSLFFAVPFGTIAYLAAWGFFDKGGASVLLGVVMTLKIAFAVCLFLAQQRFVQVKSLVFLVLTSFLAGVIVSLLHGIVPGILVSITDGIAAIIVGILAAIWAVVMLITAIPPVLRALNVSRV